jgi:hypothetical protein
MAGLGAILRAMPAIKKTTIVLSIALAAAVSLAAPASAGPAVDACSMAGVPLCAFMPVLPAIDSAIDTGLQPGTIPDLTGQFGDLGTLGTALTGH